VAHDWPEAVIDPRHEGGEFRLMARHLKTALILAAFVAAASCGLAAPAARFSDAISESTFLAITYASAGVALLLFASMILDPATHYAFGAVSREMQGDQLSKSRFLSLFDEDWGLFGTKFGNGFLLGLRCVMFVEFLGALVTTPRMQWLYGAAPLILAAVGFAISVLLTLDRIKDHYPRPMRQ
jgi:hypothetical protein